MHENNAMVCTARLGMEQVIVVKICVEERYTKRLVKQPPLLFHPGPHATKLCRTVRLGEHLGQIKELICGVKNMASYIENALTSHIKLWSRCLRYIQLC